MQIIAAHISDPIPNPRKIAMNVSDATAGIIMRMMEKKRDARYQSWDEAIEALSGAVETLTTSTGAETSIVSIADMDAATRDVPKRAAKGDVVDNIKVGIVKKLFSDLRIRFAVLVALLFIVFVAFFRLVTNSMAEAKRVKAKSAYATAEGIMRGKPRSKREFEKAYSALLAAKKAGDPKFAALADEKLRELERQIERFKQQRATKAIQMVLRDLKSRSTRLEETGDLDGALRLWSDYREKGDYASQLDGVILERMAYLKREKDKKAKAKEGVE